MARQSAQWILTPHSLICARRFQAHPTTQHHKREIVMNTRITFSVLVTCAAATLFIGCGGGGGSSGGGGDMTPPPSETVNFNATVRTLATQPESPDAASESPMDLNTPTWVFDNEDDTAFDDLFL